MLSRKHSNIPSGRKSKVNSRCVMHKPSSGSVNVSKKYIFPLHHTIVRKRITDPRFKSIEKRCKVTFSVTSKVMNRPDGFADLLGWNRYRVVRLDARNEHRIIRFNRLVLKSFPEYADKEEYRREVKKSKSHQKPNKYRHECEQPTSKGMFGRKSRTASKSDLTQKQCIWCRVEKCRARIEQRPSSLQARLGCGDIGLPRSTRAKSRSQSPKAPSRAKRWSRSKKGAAVTGGGRIMNNSDMASTFVKDEACLTDSKSMITTTTAAAAITTTSIPPSVILLPSQPQSPPPPTITTTTVETVVNRKSQVRGSAKARMSKAKSLSRSKAEEMYGDAAEINVTTNQTSLTSAGDKKMDKGLDITAQANTTTNAATLDSKPVGEECSTTYQESFFQKTSDPVSHSSSGAERSSIVTLMRELEKQREELESIRSLLKSEKNSKTDTLTSTIKEESSTKPPSSITMVTQKTDKSSISKPRSSLLNCFGRSTVESDDEYAEEDDDDMDADAAAIALDNWQHQGRDGKANSPPTSHKSLPAGGSPRERVNRSCSSAQDPGVSWKSSLDTPPWIREEREGREDASTLVAHAEEEEEDEGYEDYYYGEGELQEEEEEGYEEQEEVEVVEEELSPEKKKKRSRFRRFWCGGSRGDAAEPGNLYEPVQEVVDDEELLVVDDYKDADLNFDMNGGLGDMGEFEMHKGGGDLLQPMGDHEPLQLHDNDPEEDYDEEEGEGYWDEDYWVDEAGEYGDEEGA